MLAKKVTITKINEKEAVIMHECGITTSSLIVAKSLAQLLLAEGCKVSYPLVNHGQSFFNSVLFTKES